MSSAVISMIQELYFDNAGTEAWEGQMKLLSQNPILPLRDYRKLPEDIFQWKDDGKLHPAVSAKELQRKELSRTPTPSVSHRGLELVKKTAPNRLCVGIGKYQTAADGTLYLCAILQRQTGIVLSYSFGVFRSPELVRRALDIFFTLYEPGAGREPRPLLPSLLSSRNPIYRTHHYREIVSAFQIESVMTQQGSRGQAAEVSTFFSQLMRRKGSIEFQGWQDGIDWLTMYILRYNLCKI